LIRCLNRWPRDHCGMKTKMRALLILPSWPACPAFGGGGVRRGRTVVSGETVAQVARRCGVNPQALRQFNPGLSDRTIRAGQVIQVPPRPLPSPQLGHGRPQVKAQPPAAGSPEINVRVPRPAPSAGPLDQAAAGRPHAIDPGALLIHQQP
jgi:hypothetical protein